MTYTDKLRDFGKVMATIPGEVFHYNRTMKSTPYTIWQEDGGDKFEADGQLAEQAVTGTVDYFTKEEYDPQIDVIQQMLDSLPITWALESVQYEEDTGIIHYEWSWSW